MKKSLVLLFLLLSFVCPARGPEMVQVGVYINRIDAFDIKTGTAKIDFWLWGRRVGSKKPILATLEVSNGQVSQTGELIKKQQGNVYYECNRYNAEIACRVNLKKFPFDRQTLKICIEDNESLANQMILVADTRNSRIDPSWRLHEWHISSLRCYSDEHLYPTSFGDPDVKDADGNSRYSRLNIEIGLTRRGSFVSKCFKYFWAIIISVIVGLFALWIFVADLDARFGMNVGALFANVGCSFIIADKLPDSPELTVAELVSLISLGIIMILLVESIISLCLHNHGKVVFSKRLDHWSFWGILIGYSAAIVYLLYGATGQ